MQRSLLINTRKVLSYIGDRIFTPQSKIVPSLTPSVFAKNISPTHRFDDYFFVNADEVKGFEFVGGARFVISIFGLGVSLFFENGSVKNVC